MVAVLLSGWAMKLLKFKLVPLSTDESAGSGQDKLALTGWDETRPGDQPADFSFIWPETIVTFKTSDFVPVVFEIRLPAVHGVQPPAEKPEDRPVPVFCVFPWLEPAESPENPHQPITCVFPPPKPVETTERPHELPVCVIPSPKHVEWSMPAQGDGLWGSTPEFPCQFQPADRLNPRTGAVPEAPGSPPPLSLLVSPDFVPPVNAANPDLVWAI
jgi:hypothetical protein